MVLRILYEDNHILAVFKPAGILVQRDRSRQASLFDLAKAYLKKKYKKSGRVYLGLVHRLDRPTCGVVIFAKTSKAASRMSCEFREHRVKKIYWAVVEGNIPTSAELQHILLRDRRSGNSRIVKKLTPGGKVARLSYRIIRKRDNLSLLEIVPETGRHHQIRVQFSSIGAPVVGDVRYGSSKKVPNRGIKLLARQIIFSHPVKKQKISIKSPIPPGFF